MQHLDERFERWRQMESAALAAEQACSNFRGAQEPTLLADATEKRRLADSYLAAIREEIRVAPAPPRIDPRDDRPATAARGIERP